MVGIMEDAAQMKQRFRHIVAFSPRRVVGSLAGVACALALAAIVLGRQAERVALTHYEGLSPAEILVTAARSGVQPVVERMLVDGVDVNSVASVRGERTALSAAVAANRLDILRLLTERGVDFLNKPENGDIPLVIALKRGATECEEYLLRRGATCAPELLSAAKGEATAIEEL